MSMRRLVFWITLLAVFAMAARISVDTDTWWHLRAGQWILENQEVPQQDPFSYTRAGEAWQYPGWLVEVPLFWIYQALGPGGLNLWAAGMVTLAFYFVWQTMSGGVFLRAFVVVLAAAASGVYWAARPYMVTFVLAALFLWILEDSSSGRKDRVWWLPLLMILWANSHGGFIIGFIIWGVYFVEGCLEVLGALLKDGLTLKRSTLEHLTLENHQLRKLFLIGIGMLAAVVLNPSGPIMLLYPFKTVAIDSLREFIQEWQSPDFHNRQVQPFLWLLFLTLGAVGFSGRRMKPADFFLVTGFGYLAFLAGRNISLFAIAAPMVLSRHAADVIQAVTTRVGMSLKVPSAAVPTKFQSRLNIFLLVIILIAVVIKVGLVFPRKANAAFFEESLPVGTVAYLQENSPPGRLFNHYNWGGYLVWALPEYPVFIDGRTDLYDDDVIETWLQVVRADPGWEAVLEGWGVNLVLIEPGMPLAAALEASGWALLAADEVSVLYGR